MIGCDQMAARVSRLTAVKESDREHQNSAMILAGVASRNAIVRERRADFP
jgi:hypothetical protein